MSVRTKKPHIPSAHPSAGTPTLPFSPKFVNDFARLEVTYQVILCRLLAAYLDANSQPGTTDPSDYFVTSKQRTVGKWFARSAAERDRDNKRRVAAEDRLRQRHERERAQVHARHMREWARRHGESTR